MPMSEEDAALGVVLAVVCSITAFCFVLLYLNVSVLMTVVLAVIVIVSGFTWWVKKTNAKYREMDKAAEAAAAESRKNR